MPLRLPRPLQFKPDELYQVPTADGSAIALGRYSAHERKRFAWPILFAHGLGTNRFNLDFDERYSVARAFARQGFETWVLELRGHGLAGVGDGSTFDVEATHDVTAALQAITSTGAERVGWVGHSRGGLLAFAHLARNPTAPIGPIAALASPFSFADQHHVRRFVSVLNPALRISKVPLSLAKLVSPFGLPPTPVSPYLLCAENVEPEVMRRALAYAVSDVPGGVARQFARWVTTGVFDGEDGFDYRAALALIRQPVMLVAGAADLLAPPSAVHAAQRLLAGPTECLSIGRAHGFEADLGHGDLVLARSAPTHVVPRIIEFFTRHVPRILNS